MKKINSLKKDDISILVCCILAGVLISWLLYDSFILGLAFAFAYLPVKKAYAGFLEKKKKREIEVQFSDFLYYISISFSLGRNLMQGIDESLINLREIYGKDAYLIRVLEEIASNYSRSNIEDISILERVDNEDIGDFVRVYRNCKESGGNMVEAIGSASRIISEKIQVNQEIRTQSSQRKLEGRIIAAMPFLVILFLKLTGPDYLEIMYSSFAGRIIMSLALALTALAWVLTERITKVSL